VRALPLLGLRRSEGPAALNSGGLARRALLAELRLDSLASDLTLTSLLERQFALLLILTRVSDRLFAPGLSQLGVRSATGYGLNELQARVACKPSGFRGPA